MSLKKKFAIAAGAVVIALSGGVGAAAAVNGLDRQTVSGVDSKGKPVTLHTVTLKPVFEKQNFSASGYQYWCWSLATVTCPLPAHDADKPAYEALRQQLKK